MAKARYFAQRESRNASSLNTKAGTNKRASVRKGSRRNHRGRMPDFSIFAGSASCGGVAASGSLIAALLRCENTRRPELNERNHQKQDEYLRHRLVAQEFRYDAVAGADNGAPGNR